MIPTLTLYYLLGVSSIGIIAGVAYWIAVRYQKHLSRKVLIPIIAASGYIFFAQALKFDTLHMYVDLSHWLQVLESIMTTGAPNAINVEFIFPGAINFFSIHFTPLIYLFAPVFALFPHPKTLLFLQAFVMFSSIIPLSLLAKRMQGSKVFALFIVALFVWYPTFQYITLYEFEMLRFSIPIMLWMLYFWEERRMPLFLLFVLLALLVREEIGLTIFTFGVYIFLVEKKRYTGMGISALGLTYFFAIVTLVIPYFNNATEASYLPFSIFAKFGSSPLEIFYTILTNPKLFLDTIFSVTKLANIGMLLIPLLLAPLAALPVLISTLANLGISLLSDEVEHSSYMLYYIAPMVPFVFYATLKGWGKITKHLHEGAVMVAMLSAVIIANIFFGPSPLSVQFWSEELRPAPFRTQRYHWTTYRVEERHKQVQSFVDLIPDDAIVSAEQLLTPRLTKKRGAMIFPQTESVDRTYFAEYVFIDKVNPLKTGVLTVPGSWDGLRQHPESYYAIIENDTEHWERIREDYGYALYRRKSVE